MLSTTIGQTQSMKLQQTLAPQMRQGLKMLQMTSLELRAELQHEMETNPAIDDVASRAERQMSVELPDSHSYAEVTEKPLDFGSSGEMGAVMGAGSADDGYRDYFLGNLQSASGDEEGQSRRDHLFDSMVKRETLQQHLIGQIALSDIPAEDRELAAALVGNIDDDGYFRGSVPDIMMGFKGADERRIERTLAAIREFDPPGCGARDLRECWLAQMEKLDDSPWEDEIRALLEKHFDDLAARRVPAICKALRIEEADYPRLLKELALLDPMPGRTFAAREGGGKFAAGRGGFVQRVAPGEYVRPEVFVARGEDGTLQVRVDGRDIPEIRISQRYLKMLEDPAVSAEAKSYIRERVRAAETLRDNVRRRQQTIRDIAQAIVDAQPEVFARGGLHALKPLTMQQIGEQVGVAGTTVSRTVRDKYMATPFGVVEMRRFFTSGGAKTDDGGAVSDAAVKARIKEIIASEDAARPLSDDAITQRLNADGVEISRRTVAKYRAAMKIPGKAERARPVR